MKAEFWHQLWEDNQLGFHEQDGNQYLKKNIPSLNLENEARVFIPLCGKTHDIQWLLSLGLYVVGAELSELAIIDLFKALNLKPIVSDVSGFKKYSAERIEIFVGDVFALNESLMGSVSAVYDRAALVALPEDMRVKYSKLLIDITNCAQQLLITFEYDQNEMAGPPFSISPEEINDHYYEAYHIQELSSELMSEGLKGVCPAKEVVWHLRSKTIK